MLVSFFQTLTKHRDTVSSVGIMSQLHPFTSVNYSVKCVRHALALDEHRAKFRADMWCEPAPSRGHELDIDFPIPEHEEHEHGAIRDDWIYVPPDRDYADVKEVWFAGNFDFANVSKVADSSQVPMQTLVETRNSRI